MTLKYKNVLENIKILNKSENIENIIVNISFSLFLFDENYNHSSILVNVDLKPPKLDNFINFEDLDDDTVINFAILELGQEKFENIKKELQEAYNKAYIEKVNTESVRFPKFQT